MEGKRLGKWMSALLVMALAAAGVGLEGTTLEGATNVRIVQLSLMTGAVEINLPDGHGWRPALLDAPLVQGEQVRTLASGRAEIQLENGSTLRLIPNSQLDLATLSLSDQGIFSTSAKLAAGTTFVTLRKEDSKDFRLLLPSGATVIPDGSASFRADASTPNAAAAVTVYDGKASVEAGDHSVSLKKDEVARLTSQQLLATALDTSHPDPWTEWSRTRDQYYQAALHDGIQAGGLSSYVNWYDTAPDTIAPPVYAGTGLAYLGGNTCPWSVTRGDYAGWCWSEPSGWFRPSQAPTITPAALANASDVAQTNSQLASVAAAGSQNGVQSFYNPAGLYYYNGLNPCAEGGMPFDPLLNPLFDPMGGMGGYALFNGMYNSFYGGPLYGGWAGGCPLFANGWMGEARNYGGGGVSPVASPPVGARLTPPGVRPRAPGNRFTPAGGSIHGGAFSRLGSQGQTHQTGMLPASELRASGVRASHTAFSGHNFSGGAFSGGAGIFAGARPAFTATAGARPAVERESSAFSASRAQPSGGMSAVGHVSSAGAVGVGGGHVASSGSSSGHTSH